MPGSIANSTVTDVFPPLLYAAFTEAPSWPVQENRYRNGELQAAPLTASSRKGYSATLRLTPDALATFRTFYYAHGRHTPFQFTPPDGVMRYVRFTSSWSQSAGMARTEVLISLIEVA